MKTISVDAIKGDGKTDAVNVRISTIGLIYSCIQIPTYEGKTCQSIFTNVGTPIVTSVRPLVIPDHFTHGYIAFDPMQEYGGGPTEDVRKLPLFDAWVDLNCVVMWCDLDTIRPTTDKGVLMLFDVRLSALSHKIFFDHNPFLDLGL